MDPTAVPDVLKKRKMSCMCRDSNPDRKEHSLVPVVKGVARWPYERIVKPAGLHNSITVSAQRLMNP
jgi:hypothetical protein